MNIRLENPPVQLIQDPAGEKIIGPGNEKKKHRFRAVLFWLLKHKLKQTGVSQCSTPVVLSVQNFFVLREADNVDTVRIVSCFDFLSFLSVIMMDFEEEQVMVGDHGA